VPPQSVSQSAQKFVTCVSCVSVSLSDHARIRYTGSVVRYVTSDKVVKLQIEKFASLHIVLPFGVINDTY